MRQQEPTAEQGLVVMQCHKRPNHYDKTVDFRDGIDINKHPSVRKRAFKEIIVMVFHGPLVG